MDAPLFKGVPITLGGTAYVLPKLSFGGFADAKAKIQAIAEGQFDDPVELQDAVADVILAALRRNYPALERSALVDVLDWDSAQEIFNLVLQISVPAPPPGERAAESPSGISTGTQPSPT